MRRHYELDRNTGRMTIAAASMDENGEYGERFLDGVSVCNLKTAIPRSDFGAFRNAASAGF